MDFSLEVLQPRGMGKYLQQGLLWMVKEPRDETVYSEDVYDTL